MTTNTSQIHSEAASNELKIRARLLLKALQAHDAQALARSEKISKKQAWPIPEKWTLRHALNMVAFETGFPHWEQARAFLNGQCAQDIPAGCFADTGEFWHGHSSGFINQWFAAYPEALAQLDQRHYLLPYKTQFFIAGPDFIEALGLGRQTAAWQAVNHNLVAGYGSAAWQSLCVARLQAQRAPAKAAASTGTATQDAPPEEFSRRVLTTFVADGRLNKIPQMRKKRLVILQWLVQQLENGRRYTEKEINAFLLQFHEDFATLRREFIACKLMVREDGVYWRC